MRVFTYDRSQLPEAETKKWIEGLRSGKFEQTRGLMCREETPNSACCLHVAAMVVDGVAWSTGLGHGSPIFMGGEPMFARMAEAVNFERIGDANYCRPATLNDREKLTFNQIADLLEHGRLEVE